jgi:Tetratricopeptide repeat
VDIDNAFLAEYALAHDDGTYYVIGGFLERITAPRLPIAHPHISVVVRGRFADDECGRKHRLSLRILWQAETEISSHLSVEFEPESRDGSGSPFQCIFAVRDLVLPAEGQFDFVILHDGQQAARLPLAILASRTPRPETVEVFASPVAEGMIRVAAEAILQDSMRSRVSRHLRDGFAAFTAGDMERASQAFREAIAQDASNPVAHNNLGYVLLGQGHPDDALAAFRQAAALGYREMEVLNVNLGCAAYLKAEYEEAFQAFTSCLRETRAGTPSELWLIIDGRLRSMPVQSVGAYVALLAANAAWAALKAGRTAADWVTMARAALEALDENAPGHSTLAESIRILGTQN